ncbi:MAG: HAMP domain-containing histidine kinase [Anaerolineae bacterium]|nr:HAMP domain-containing histidine kinase [Anaerolineae bacterium]
MLTVDGALEILARFQSAAPPAAAEKLTGVMELLRTLDANQAKEPEPSADKPQSVTDLLAELVGEAGSSTSTQDLGMTSDDYFDEDASPTDLLNQVLNPDAEVERAEANLKWPKRGGADLWAADVERGTGMHPAVVAADAGGTPYLNLITTMQKQLQGTLAAIRGHADRLYSGGTGHLMPGQSEAMRSIREHVDGALSLIDAMQRIEALQTGRYAIQLNTFDSAELIRRARDLMKAAARAHGHHINFEAPENPIRARADFDQSLAILVDLIDNAIRYTPEADSIGITLDNLGSHVLISVVDTGIGLSQADLTHVGTPFWRALHQPVVQENPGSGLRLHLAQQILHLQDGELIFSGELNKGSTFSFTLPVA